jgi:mRNA interferase RelE/StbE
VGSYRILTTRRFLRHLKRLEGEVRERVLDTVREVSERPYLGSTLMFDELRLYKFRVGDYRLVYEVDEEKKAVLFLIVNHRRRVYREFRT